MLALVASCKERSREPPPRPAQAEAGPATALRVIARVPGATLVAGSRRVAVVTPAGWHELARGGLVRDARVTDELAALRDELGRLELYLGARPIAVGGEEHHERHVRLAPARQELAVAGHVVRVAALPSGPEVWQVEERLRARLVVIAGGREPGALPAHASVGPPVDAPSPVTAKRCAAPAIADLVASRDAIHALLVECHPEAPVRIATYRWPGPEVRIATLPSSARLGFEPAQLAGEHVVAGVAGGALWIARDGEPRRLLTGVTVLLEAVLADDGALWTLATTASGARRIARDGDPVAPRGPSGEPLAPSTLALDDDRGVTVLAGDWLLVEH